MRVSGIWARRALIGLSVLLVLAGLALAVSETLASARLATLGSRTSVASREGIAIDLLRLSQPLALATLDFRDAVIGGDRAARADPAARLAQDLSALHRLLNTPAGRRLELAADEKKLQSAWSRARSAPDGWGSLARVSAPLNDIVVLLQDAGDTSDFSYERSHATQSLADIGINDLPSSLMFPRRNDLLVAHLRAVRGIPLDLRLGFNSSSAAIIGNFDLEQDHLAHTTASLTKSLPAAQHGAIARFLRAAKGYVQAGSQFGALVNTVARAPRVDAKTQSRLKALSARAEAAANALYAPTIGMLRADLAARSASFERSRFARALALLGIVLLIVGALSLALLIAGMRSSRALEDAQRERERLAAELARQETERALHLSEAQFRAVFDGATMGIAILNNRGRVVDANAVYRSIVDIDLHLLEGHESDFAEVMNGARDAFTIERRIGGLHGEMWVDVTISGVTDASGAHQLAMCTFADKTTIKQQEHRLNFQRLHDALTGLPNRQAFEEHLNARFDLAHRDSTALFAVIFVDLEHFKDVNESLGHGGGDAVLRQISTRLRGSLESEDFVARLGSDEFAIVIGDLGDVIHVESIARRLLDNLSKPFTIEGRSIFLGASIGIAIAPEQYERGDEVLRDSEIAMQYAKTVGHERFAVFDSEMQTAARERVALAADLRFAVERRELRVLYQPVVDLASGRIIGAEALLRWDHPTRGTISPLLFIPLAERGGFARSIGSFVLDTGCSQLAAWRRAGIDLTNFTMHFNATPTELLEAGFERILSSAIDEYALRPSNVAIEITENSMLDDTALAIERIERVRERGFQVCIDDFGTGYSSMRYMQQFKIDAIKIDKGFVAGEDGGLASEPIVHTLVRLSQAFGVRVVAEGVETERQRELLLAAGCRDAQGFLFARPLSAVEFRARLDGATIVAPSMAS